MSVTATLRTALPESQTVFSQPTPLSKVNYLNRCIENISEETEKRHRMSSNINKAIAIAAGVIYIASVIVSVAIAAIFSPPSIPFVALGAFCLTPTIQNFIKSKLSVSFQSKVLSEQASVIRRISQDGPSTPEEMIQALQALGIPFQSITDIPVKNNPLLLKGILAHYIFYHRMAQDCAADIDAKRQIAEDHAIEHPNETKQILSLRTEALAQRETSLVAKLRASFYLGLLKSPRFSKELYDSIQLESRVEGFDIASDLLTLGQRSLAAQFNDPRATILAEISHAEGRKTQLTKERLEQMSEHEIAETILA